MLRLLFVDRIKIHLRTKESIFWLLLFPIILATLFNFAFAKILDGEAMEPVKVAITIDESTNPERASIAQIYKSVFGSDSFEAEYVDDAEGKKLLEDGKVSGHIVIGNDIDLSVTDTGIDQSILKEVLDYVEQETRAVTDIASEKGKVDEAVINVISKMKSYINEIKTSDNEPNLIVVYFYTVLGMVAMYGGMSGMEEVNMIQANQSKVGMRVNLGGLSKMKIFLVNLFSTCLMQMLIMLIILLYIQFVLGIDFGNRYGLIVLNSCVGAVTGISFGTFVGAVVKKDPNFKTGIIISLTMIWCFLAGMMGDGIRYAVKNAAPLIDKLNPVSIITDNYYRLYYYDDLSGFFGNLGILIGIAAVFFALTVVILRRQKYDYL